MTARRAETPVARPAARLDDVLAASRAQGRAALGLYLPVGYPTFADSLDALRLMGQAADVLEIGIPHTHHVLDGPVIKEAAAQALAHGFRMEHVFTAAAELTASTPAALVAMSYWARIQTYGPQRFADEFASAGGAAVLVPDLPASAAAAWQAAARTASLLTITLVPTDASAAHLAAIGAASGMVYAPAAPGLTGGQSPLSPNLPHEIHRIRTATGRPVAVGIGVSTPEQAGRLSAHADAVVVGSAVIRRMQAQPATPATAAGSCARTFADGVRHAAV
ncbi:tryptophan synthase subunit alpha [Streptomyces sp. NPDC101455]|uniref:tryptophan synthase subunit alpha n=1 Tax=Streptomyces sp. NPDC101455 TaxID=3366142 RepID=UPI00380D9F0F